jgi:hypothetical protein
VKARYLSAGCAIAALLFATAVGTPVAGAASGSTSAFGETRGFHVPYTLKADTPSDAWLVGSHTPMGYDAMVKHWDGLRWTNQRAVNARLAGVIGTDATAPNDAWMTGWYAPKQGGDPRALIMHWDGTSWHRMHTPTPLGLMVAGITEIRPRDDVWAVGAGDGTGAVGEGSLAEHWDGSRWTIVSTPNLPGVPNGLYNPVSFGPNDVWALLGTPDEHLAEHWNGKKWSIVQLPDSNYTLSGLSGSASDDIWIVGDGPGTITEHYDGLAWNIIPSANPPEGEPVLQSVTSISSDDVWAVGGIYALAPKVRTLVEHWDGTSWSIVPSPSPGAKANVLDSVSGTGPDDVWAIGTYTDAGDGASRILYLHWDGTRWTHFHNPPATG